VLGGVPAGLPEVAGIALTEDEAAADLVWDRSKHTLDSRVGGRVAEGLKDGDMPAILSKASALAFIKARTSDNPVALSLASGNQTYKRGESVDITMTGVRLPYLPLQSAPQGRVEFFWPLDQKETEKDWRQGHFAQSFRVDKPPYGAENMVAILTAEPALALHEALKSMPTAETAGGLAATLRSSLKGKEFQAGVVGIFTGRRMMLPPGGTSTASPPRRARRGVVPPEPRGGHLDRRLFRHQAHARRRRLGA
jgi:hypothetical protein